MDLKQAPPKGKSLWTIMAHDCVALLALAERLEELGRTDPLPAYRGGESGYLALVTAMIFPLKTLTEFVQTIQTKSPSVFKILAQESELVSLSRGVAKIALRNSKTYLETEYFFDIAMTVCCGNSVVGEADEMAGYAVCVKALEDMVNGRGDALLFAKGWHIKAYEVLVDQMPTVIANIDCFERLVARTCPQFNPPSPSGTTTTTKTLKYPCIVRMFRLVWSHEAKRASSSTPTPTTGDIGPTASSSVDIMSRYLTVLKRIAEYDVRGELSTELCASFLGSALTATLDKLMATVVTSVEANKASSKKTLIKPGKFLLYKIGSPLVDTLIVYNRVMVRTNRNLLRDFVVNKFYTGRNLKVMARLIMADTLAEPTRSPILMDGLMRLCLGMACFEDDDANGEDKGERIRNVIAERMLFPNQSSETYDDSAVFRDWLFGPFEAIPPNGDVFQRTTSTFLILSVLSREDPRVFSVVIERLGGLQEALALCDEAIMNVSRAYHRSPSPSSSSPSSTLTRLKDSELVSRNTFAFRATIDSMASLLSPPPSTKRLPLQADLQMTVDGVVVKTGYVSFIPWAVLIFIPVASLCSPNAKLDSYVEPSLFAFPSPPESHLSRFPHTRPVDASVFFNLMGNFFFNRRCVEPFRDPGTNLFPVAKVNNNDNQYNAPVFVASSSGYSCYSSDTIQTDSSTPSYSMTSWPLSSPTRDSSPGRSLRRGF